MIYLLKTKSSHLTVAEKCSLDISLEAAWRNPLKFLRSRKSLLSLKLHENKQKLGMGKMPQHDVCLLLKNVFQNENFFEPSWWLNILTLKDSIKFNKCTKNCLFQPHQKALLNVVNYFCFKKVKASWSTSKVLIFFLYF